MEQRITETENKRESLSGMLDEDENKTEKIRELLASSKSHEEIIQNFSARVEKRGNQLDSQEIKTIGYEDKLDGFSGK